MALPVSVENKRPLRPALLHRFSPRSCRKASEEEERGLDHIYIACLRLYFLNYLDSYRYAPKLWHVSSAIAETAETADVELD